MQYIVGEVIDKPNKINILAIFYHSKYLIQEQKFACKDELCNYLSELPPFMLITNNLSCQAFCHVVVNACT